MSDIDQLARSIGSAIAARRKALDMTQEQLSELVQIEQSSLSRIERGTLVPSIERVAGIAEKLQCRLADLLSTAGTAPLDRAIRIHEKLSPLSSAQQEVIERLVDDAIALLDVPAARRPSRSGSISRKK
ncbi:helix-turn-helix domain-containing protein [Paraburkholderia nemoris]|uniref:helix-turn-helix domain-containing protein n=1 Tax=Paraburkholderia nemoris TaxID=2793076 RepID=UPI001F3AFC33|nr:helix-turn-helix transcriptional regulator [Paraburkholderia nemoris]